MLYNTQLMRLAGADGVAAYGVIMYANFIFAAIYLGYSMGSAPITSYNYGAGNHSELKNMLKKSLSLIAVTGVCLTLISEFFAHPLINKKLKILSKLTEHTLANEIEAPKEVLRKEFQK